MKPFKFGFSCPSCKTNLQSEPKDSGTASNCPVCNYGITVPAAPPRPIDGFLLVLAVGMALGIVMNLVWVPIFVRLGGGYASVIAILIVCQIALFCGFLARRKWVRWVYPSFMALSLIFDIWAAFESGKAQGVAKAVTGLIIVVLVSLYFMKSQRVKETFIL